MSDLRDRGYIKVRLADENNQNGEIAWAYAQKSDGEDFFNVYGYPELTYKLTLDNSTDYFPVGTELILSEDGYNVDMEATRQLVEAKNKILQLKQAGKNHRTNTTYNTIDTLLKRKALSEFSNSVIQTRQGFTELRDIVERENQVFIEGVRKTESGVQKILYSDIPFLEEAKKIKVGEYHSVWSIEKYAEEVLPLQNSLIEVYFVPEEQSEKFYTYQYTEDGYTVPVDGGSYYFNPNPLFDIDYGIKVGEIVHQKFSFDQAFIQENSGTILDFSTDEVELKTIKSVETTESLEQRGENSMDLLDDLESFFDNLTVDELFSDYYTGSEVDGVYFDFANLQETYSQDEEVMTFLEECKIVVPFEIEEVAELYKTNELWQKLSSLYGIKLSKVAIDEIGLLGAISEEVAKVNQRLTERYMSEDNEMSSYQYEEKLILLEDIESYIMDTVWESDYGEKYIYDCAMKKVKEELEDYKQEILESNRSI